MCFDACSMRAKDFCSDYYNIPYMPKAFVLQLIIAIFWCIKLFMCSTLLKIELNSHQRDMILCLLDEPLTHQILAESKF